MPFLRRIRRVDLRRKSQPLRDIVREDDGEDILISDGPDVRIWRVGVTYSSVGWLHSFGLSER